MNPIITNLLIFVTSAVISFVICDIIRRRRDRERRRRLEKTQKILNEMRSGFLANLAAQAGGDLVEPIQVEEIKYGDRVCWHPEDMSDHQHYVAGYDGDPGPSTDGVHARPIAQRGERA